LKIREKEKEKLLVAYNKKRITEIDITKANKKAMELGLPYIIINLGELPKKLDELLKAIKNLDSIKKIK